MRKLLLFCYHHHAASPPSSLLVYIISPLIPIFHYQRKKYSFIPTKKAAYFEYRYISISPNYLSTQEEAERETRIGNCSMNRNK